MDDIDGHVPRNLFGGGGTSFRNGLN
jgi:hypothetical protein